MRRLAVWGWWCAGLVAGVVACGSDEIRQASQQSQCGGFTQALGAEPAADEAPVSYCDASVLYWRYSAAAHRLQLLLTRLGTSCDGRFSLSLAPDPDGGYEVTLLETHDGPLADCECVFDVRLEAPFVAQALVRVVLTRAWVVAGHRHEASLPAWTLDLAQGEGQIILDSRPMPDCRPS
jgi:hypothetical protein